MNKANQLKKTKLLLLFMIATFILPLGAFAQANLKGRVLDETGQPLPGAAVKAKGGTSSTLTGANGDFELKSSSSISAIIVSYIGYESKEVNVSGKTNITVTLNPDQKNLQEVVVIGYGTQRAEAVTGSVASIKGEALREVPSANITQALQGRVAGVEMTQTSSRPGSGMQIRIRGTRSLNADPNSGQDAPLVVLDGIPFSGSINDIDPNSIRSIDILKDASATAIYGSRGANGVILVTSFRGQKGQAARVSYNSFYGLKNLFSRVPMMDGPEFARLRTEATKTQQELNIGTFAPSSDELDNANTDWQDLLYRNAMTMSHDVNLSKGSERGNFSVGIGYYKDQSVLPTNDFNRYSIRAAVDQEAGKYFRFGLTSNNSYTVTEGNQVGISDALGASPLASPYDANGNLKRSTYASTDPYKVWTKDLINDLKDRWLSEAKGLGSYNNMYVEVRAPWVEGLKARVNLGLNIRQTTGGNFTGKGVTSATNPNEPSTAGINNSTMTDWAIENLLTYDRRFGKHEFNAVGLYSAQENTFYRSDISVRDLAAEHFQYFNLGQAPQGNITINPDNQGHTVWGLQSWMGRVMYNYDNRYMLSATLRADGSSRLAPGRKWHTYPAVSAGWNIAQESFMSEVTPLSLLKLRVGYGVTSNQAVAPYATLGRLSNRFYNFGDNGDESYETGYIISELPNENLGWEFTNTWNFGLDFGLFAGRLSGTIEYYKQHTKDILLAVDLPPTTGVNRFTSNIGETENKGFELSLNGVIIDNPNGFRWEAGVNLYTNRNKLLALTSGSDRNEGNWWFVGHPINVIYDYERIGLWQTGDSHLNVLEPGGNVGMIKVKYTGEYDNNGVPVRQIGAADRQILDFDPKFQGGFNTRFSYKGFDLGIVAAFKNGGTLISTLHGGTSYLNLLNGRHNNVSVDYWTPENTGAKYPRPGGITAADNPKYMSTMAYFDASYLKIRTISLGYNFNGKWMENAGISQARIYFTAQNPFVLFSPFHKESGMDPEPNSYGNQNQAVTTQIVQRLPVVGYNVPATRNYLVGLNFTF
ncbi:TonB-dependent receptor plug [Pseudopedobacter saltans DSM 12145]|uniref:TonB-dependent receptor plug n=1 Tax=Pseudopedobacter saltans (strain ATCC 51119 / DSM 12145 / JCM 21818 / CCUG 39354 / LMG 10337 / NBRC 100064 / NCIMB 13643) TaxID=762903 RepID=F0S6Z3_PSESL|nr:TonB-dependent receptor [Pseudopedobacter saltans]ADY53256.1 TonB-dependent receptor plug [Pseudopedobacter saltans DSM 12145]